jgi:fluoroacetyl-CoA thioesterase
MSDEQSCARPHVLRTNREMSPRPTIADGAIGTVAHVVGPNDLASALSTDPEHRFPDVFATSRMIALMELAAARVLQSILQEGELSVGVTVDITHSAATLPGVEVRTTGTFQRMEGKLYVFEVVAFDPGGEIGRGVHRRAIVTTERLLSGAAKRR